ncbi:MAG TPA: translation initiation factor [Salinivirgaceae bacterium]|nr:translation initiation factor [Salinivirgaceae bacterium]
MSRKNKTSDGIVFSTNRELNDSLFFQEEETETLAPSLQNLRVMLDKKQRGGKQVTLVTGFVGKHDDLTQLGKLLKTKCGVGGTVKDGEILIQGNFVEKIIAILKEMGYGVKKSGG